MDIELKKNPSAGGHHTASGISPQEFALAAPIGEGTAEDFWELGTMGMGGAPANAEFSELLSLQKTQQRGRLVMALLGLLVLLPVGYTAYDILFNDHNPWTDVLAMILPEDEAPPADPVAPPAKTPPVAANPHKLTGKLLKAVAGNPYWALPNKILGANPAVARAWNSEEEETWRANLNHRYVYQHYKAVQEIRAGRLAGSQALLWEALRAKKLWPRLFAAVGLAEFNVEVPVKTLDDAMSKARSEQVANFFERFTHRPNAGQLFILRQAVRLLDERGRLVALRGIVDSRDELRDLYMAAATIDPGRHVQSWAHEALRRRPVPAAALGPLLAVVQGQAALETLPGKAGYSIKGQEVDAKPPSLMSDDELENQLDGLETADKDNAKPASEKPSRGGKHTPASAPSPASAVDDSDSDSPTAAADAAADATADAAAE